MQWAAATCEAAEDDGPEQSKNRRTRTYEDTPQKELKGEYWFKILGEFEDEDDEAARPCMHPGKGRTKKAKR